jgi:signal transduction histidine kinase
VLFRSLVFYSLIILWRQYKINPEPQKSSIKYIIIGSIIGFTAGATNFFLWYNIPILPYGNILVSIYPLVLAIAIFKYQLFNIRVIATELLTFTIWIFVLIRFFLLETIQERLINGGLLVFLIISGILLIRSVLKEVRQREKIEELAKELETANEKLKKLDQAKSDFVTITSHQLRSPVTAIKGYASMLSEGTFGEIPEKAKMAAERIFQSSNRLVALIGDFLNLSRIERGKMEYDFKKVDLKEIIKSIIDEFKAINLTEKKNLDFSFNVSEKEDFMATIDSDKIRQVIYNLIDNAMKYTKTGFIKIFLYKEPEKRAIGLKVEDSGIGMNQGALGQIFEKFTRAEGPSTLHTEGTGLGLYVAKEILKAHEGTIWAESEGQGKGSTFCVELPYEK